MNKEEKDEITVHKEIQQELEKAIIDRDQEITEMQAKLDQKIKGKQADTKSILTYIAIGAPVFLMVYLVAMTREQNVIIAAISFASYFAGSITSPILMSYFGVDKEVQENVTQKKL